MQPHLAASIPAPNGNSTTDSIAAPVFPPTTRRAFLAGSAGLGLAFATYAATGGRHRLESTEHRVAIENLPPRFTGFRIVQLSDIHLEEFTEMWFLRHAIDRINALAPDMVLLTGDFVSRGPLEGLGRRCMPACAEALAALRCPLRYAVLGNHDMSVGSKFVVAQLAANGIPTLRNTAIPLDLGGDRLWIAGIDNASMGSPDLEKTVPSDAGAPLVLMAHEPDFFDFVRQHPLAAKIDLMLSGHTHGGQVRLPLIGPLVLPPLGQRYVAGAFRSGKTQLYVNRGLGTVDIPFRFHCPAEITVHTLQPA